MTHVLIIGNDSKSISDFRWTLIEEFRSQNWVVTLVCNKDAYFGQLKEKAAKHDVTLIPVNFTNGGISPIQDLALIFKIRQLYKQINPSHVLLYRIKPVLYGALAAYGLPLKILSTITGLGYVYTDTSLKARILKAITNSLYKIAMHRNFWVFFQNKDDQGIFKHANLINDNQSSVVGGSGVSLTEFPETPLPKTLSFIMVARLLKDKGIWEYLQAAAGLKKLYPKVNFKLAGGTSANPSAIPLADIIDFCTTHNLDYLGHQDSILNSLQDSSIFVLPSYREGMPRSGLEALSIGRPIITTDTQGCRDLIQNSNGQLVPIKNTVALQHAMQHMIDHPEQLIKMAKSSRNLARTVFDVKIVNQKMLDKILES